MPDGESTQGQEPANTPANESGATPGSSRGIDSFPEEAQDYIRRLRQENASHRTELKGARDKLKEFEDKDKTEAQRLIDRAEAAERVAASSASQLLRYEVAAAKGLPIKYAGRLQGSTKEELEADADALIKDFGLAESESPTGRPGFDGGVRRPVKRPKSMNGVIRQAAGL
jgi:predicted PilT family ATPase